VRLGLRDPASDKYAGDAEHWRLAEDNIRSVVRKLGMNYTEGVGDAVFYGPKIDFVVKDCLGRAWQLGTIQVDYNLPERFALEYAGADNTPHRPVMIHRAPFGSMERFIGILIEHYAGAFPLWLAPEQVRVLPLTERQAEYARGVAAALRAQDFRVSVDEGSEKLGAKIRAAQVDKVPYMLIVGPREAEQQAVSVRSRSAGDRGVMPLPALSEMLRAEAASKSGGPATG
jgi:threonyl-tRNA synthetase